MALAAGKLNILLKGSHQNPAWNWDMSELSFTNFTRYNEGSSTVITYRFADGRLTYLMNKAVSQPGACWNKNSGIIMSSTRDGNDAIFSVKDHLLKKLLAMPGKALYEPSWNAEGTAFVFEGHQEDVEAHGRIGKMKVGEPGPGWLTDSGRDCRQPNWSPGGEIIVYQCLVGSRWGLWVQEPEVGAIPYKMAIDGDATDATWTPDGKVLFSGEDGLYVAAVHGVGNVHPIGPRNGYRGAPSMSPDGKWIACEASAKDPDGGPGTWIELIEVT